MQFFTGMFDDSDAYIDDFGTIALLKIAPFSSFWSKAARTP